MTESFVNAYVDGEYGERIALLWRDEAGRLERRSVHAEYASYHKVAQVPDDLRREIENSRYVRSTRVEGEWFRVGWRDRQVRDDMCLGVGPERLSPLRSRGVDHYEADVHPVRRFLTDTGASIQKPRRCYLDFEGDSRVSFERKEDARVLAWALTDDDGNKYQGVLEEDTDGDEQDLLTRLWEVMKAYDQVLAWNGDNYDFPVLKARTRARGIRVDQRRLLYLDQMDLFASMNMHSAESGDEKTSLALNAVAKSLLGHGKKDFDARFTWQAWENRTPCEGSLAGDDERRCKRCRKCMADYNMEDAVLMPAIEKKTGYADVLFAICEVCHVLPESRALGNAHQMDGFMLGFGRDRSIHFATKKYREGKQEKYKGAWVMEPKEGAGILRNVHVFDFASLYPSVILTWNMSPETKVPTVPPDQALPPGVCRAPYTGICFDTAVKGILPMALDVLLDMRAPWKKLKASLPPGSEEWHDANRKDNAYKVAANALYGVTGSPWSRFFDREIAESCTQSGKWLLEQTLQAAERERGWAAVYGDTDSGFVAGTDRTAFIDFVQWCNKVLYPKLLTEVGCVDNRIKNDNEKGFSILVFVTAKRYAGYYSYYKGKDADPDNPKCEIKGLEYKRGDAALLARQLQEQVIDMLRTESRAEAYKAEVRKVLDHVLRDELPVEEISISKALQKELEDYIVKTKKDGSPGSVLPHVQIGNIMQQRGQQVTAGTKMRMIVVDGDDTSLRVIPAEDYDPADPEKSQFDRFYLWEKLVYPPTLRFLKAAFPTTDWSTGLERVRPPRGKKARPVAPNQLGFFMTTTTGPITPCNISADSEFLTGDALDRLKEVAARYPGHRPLVITLRLETGAVVVLDARARVSAEPAMLAEVDKVLWEAAARHLSDCA